MENKEEKKEKEIIQYTGCFGYIDQNGKNNKYFDDEVDLKKEEFLKHKIINLKIYTKIIDKKNRIIGLDYKLRSLFNGQEKIISHKSSEQYEAFSELKINSNEYLNRLIVRFHNEEEFISQLGFSTNKDNKILVGEEEGELKIINMNKDKNVILGTYGNTDTCLTSIGCIYSDYKNYVNSILFRFFMLRHFAKNEEFKKKWDEKYEELPPEFKFLWKTVNLPENIYGEIIKSCL